MVLGPSRPPKGRPTPIRLRELATGCTSPPGQPAARRLSQSAKRSPRSDVLGQAHAGEDLAALREVPAAEGRRGHARGGGPRAAAQDAVLVAEEDLGVLAVRVRDEARVAAKVI